MSTCTVEQMRQSLRKRSDCRFVERDEFCELLTGFRRLVRADESPADVVGLQEIDTGRRFLIEWENLLPPVPSHP
ncbi:MAG: hypothetical protein R3C10_25145 [Pirellulales bacterium]|nr:hypothetical protein [Planctomycetales bacterium]